MGKESVLSQSFTPKDILALTRRRHSEKNGRTISAAQNTNSTLLKLETMNMLTRKNIR
jgi:hypothetical protein